MSCTLLTRRVRSLCCNWRALRHANFIDQLLGNSEGRPELNPRPDHIQKPCSRLWLSFSTLLLLRKDSGFKAMAYFTLGDHLSYHVIPWFYWSNSIIELHRALCPIARRNRVSSVGLLYPLSLLLFSFFCLSLAKVLLSSVFGNFDFLFFQVMLMGTNSTTTRKFESMR